MAVKAKLILGGFFVENKLDAEAELVRKNLRDVDARHIERAEQRAARAPTARSSRSPTASSTSSTSRPSAASRCSSSATRYRPGL